RIAGHVANGDTGSRRVQAASPWDRRTEEQLDLLTRENAAAFRLNARLAVLRQGVAEQIVGAQRLLGEPCVPDKVPAVEKTESTPRFLVVEDGDDSANGVFPTLNQALSSARDGDTILLRSNGNEATKLDPVELNKKGRSDVTIRAFRGF